MPVMSATASNRATLLAPTGTLRAVYLGSNPAQARCDPVTGEARGVCPDLAAELGRRLGVPVMLTPCSGAGTVIDAVRQGAADIGFVAYAPERAGTVAFSQTYMLVEQSFMVPDASPIRSCAQIDRAGGRVGGGRGDSLTLYMRRNFEYATIVETDNTPADAKRMMLEGAFDAFGANRQRLTTLLQDMPGYRMLPDVLFGVTQTIIVPQEPPDALTAINAFIEDVRLSGFLQRAIADSGIVGLVPAPAGHDRR